MYVFLSSSWEILLPPPSRRALSSSEGEEGRSCLNGNRVLAGPFNGLGWQQYAVGGVLGVPHCGSRGFGSEDNSGGEAEAGNIEYICM